MKIREVCRRTGLTERTVRFYVEQGLLTPAQDRMNGRTYLTFSEEDIAVLDDLATLRRAQFSIGEIAELQQDFGRLPQLLAGKADALRAEANETEGYAAALEALEPASLTGLKGLAHALRHPVGAYDPAPRFGRFDPESASERDAAYADFLRRSAMRERRKRVCLAVISALLLVFLSVFCTLWTTDALPTRSVSLPVTSLSQRYPEAQLPGLQGDFRAWLETPGLTFQEAGLDAVTGNLTIYYVNQSSCVLTVECEPLDEMACALVDDQSLPLMTLLTHPETPEHRVELVVPGGAVQRYYAVYLHSESLSEDEIIAHLGSIHLYLPDGTGWTITATETTSLPLEAPIAPTPVESLPTLAPGDTLQVFRSSHWRDSDSASLPGTYRIVNADGSAAYYELLE